MKKLPREYFFVLASGMISGLIVFGGGVFAELGFSLYQISTLPYLIGLLLLIVLVFAKKISLDKKFIPIILLYGLVESGITITQFAAPVLGASVALTVLLLYIQPLWTTIISKFILKEKITKLNIIACILVLIGVLFLVDPLNITRSTLPGLIAALLGGIFLSGWITVGSHASKSGVPPTTTMFFGNLTAQSIIFLSLPLASLLVKNDQSIVGYSFDKPAILFFVIIAFGLITFILNHYLYLRGTQKVKTVDAGIIMLIEPIVGAILAAMFLDQPITLSIVLGGLLILIANYLVIKMEKNVSTN